MARLRAVAERVRLDLGAYREQLGDCRSRWRCVRSPPDCDSTGEPRRRRCGLAHELGIARVEFYHYGFVRLDALDWIRAADSRPMSRRGDSDAVRPADPRRRGRRSRRRARGASSTSRSRAAGSPRSTPDIPERPHSGRSTRPGRSSLPGLVDLHTHVFHKVTYWGIDPDPVASRSGVTTWNDAGSAGALTLTGLREFVVEPARRARDGVPQHLEHRARRRELRDARTSHTSTSTSSAAWPTATATSCTASRCGWARRPSARTGSSRCASHVAPPRSASCR